MKHPEQRALLLRRLRQFFDERGFLEVETPLLADEVIPELHIEPFSVVESRDSTRRNRWLQASPELHMKRLLSAGAKAIYQITRSFRASEQGPLHRREFTIVEWYRTGDSMDAGMQLLDDLCQTLLETKPAKRTSYAEAFQKHLEFCPHTATAKQLAEHAAAHAIAVPEGMDAENCDEWLNLLLAMKIEPQLGRDAPGILHSYPASQAVLAKIATDKNGTNIAERFELYWHGIELANGYHELTDAAELRQRFIQVNQQRQQDGRQSLPLPKSLLTAMEQGLPNCAGCALGFDRLLMLAVGAKSIDEVVAFRSD